MQPKIRSLTNAHHDQISTITTSDTDKAFPARQDFISTLCINNSVSKNETEKEGSWAILQIYSANRSDAKTFFPSAADKTHKLCS
jgi:hypothetical protein